MANNKMENNVTGVVAKGCSQICFYEDNFKFTFLSVESKMIIIEPELDFIFGKTYSGSKIAIYARKAHVPVKGRGGLQTTSYIVSNTNEYSQDITYYDALRLTGGTLNKLAIPRGIRHEHSEDSSEIIRYIDDSRKYTFFIGGCECKVTIYSSNSSNYGIEGTSLVNDTINLLLEFSEKQSLKSVYEHIAKVKELLAFMTYRRNVGFSEIKLLQYQKVFDGDLMDLADVYIKQEGEYTEKSIYENICFDDLGESIEHLLSIIFNSKDDKPGYMLGFIPEKDKDLYIMSNVKVKEICSALECELNFIDDIDNKEEENLRELIDEVKKCVKVHRKGSTALSPKTYDLIFSSISHWTSSASDRIISLYHRYEQEMEILNQSKKMITDEMINEFVKYRNKVTHGFYRVLNFDVAITSHVLAGLVYCCLLKRIGVKKERITEWCRTRLLR